MPSSRSSTPSPGHTDTRGPGTDRAASQKTRRQPSPPLDADAEVRTSYAARSTRRHPGPEPRAWWAKGPRGWQRADARASESEDQAVKVNPPDYCLDRSGTPMRREEIETPFRALLEDLREAHFGPAGVQIDQRKSQPAVARFKDDRPRADLARIAPQLRRLPLCRAPAGLVGEHGGWAYRRHRASPKSMGPLELSRRAIFALSTPLPTFGGAMLDVSPLMPSPAVRVTPWKEQGRKRRPSR